MYTKKEFAERVEYSYEKFGWTEEQQIVFNRFLRERYANYKNPINTLRSYLDTLNRLVEEIKKPFSEITYDDLIPVLERWQNEFSSATIHGRKAKLKAFLRWESGNKRDPRVEKIRSGSYVSPITLHDLLTEEEMQILREEAKKDLRNLAMVDFHLLWGPRPSESASLKIGDVKVSDTYIVINIPETKTTFRPVPIPLASVSTIKDPDFLDSALNAYSSLMKFLDIHPGFPHHPDWPLWYDENNGVRKFLEPETLSHIFRKIGRNAGLEKTVSTYMLRRTAFNRFRGVDRERLCVGFGWKPGSRMPTRVYNKLRPQEYLETLIEEEPRERDIIICPNCQKENPGDKVFCVFCSHKLTELPAAVTLEQFHVDQKAQKELDGLKEKMEKMDKILSALEKIPGFYQMLEESAKIGE
jgi:site-specific recombinase XerD